MRTLAAAALIALAPSCTANYEARGVYSGREIVGFRAKSGNDCYEFSKDGNKVVIQKLFDNGISVERALVGTVPFEAVKESFKTVDEEKNPVLKLDVIVLQAEK